LSSNTALIQRVQYTILVYRMLEQVNMTIILIT